MSIKELVEILLRQPNQNAEVRVRYGCLIAGEKIIIDDGDDLK